MTVPAPAPVDTMAGDDWPAHAVCDGCYPDGSERRFTLCGVDVTDDADEVPMSLTDWCPLCATVIYAHMAGH